MSERNMNNNDAASSGSLPATASSQISSIGRNRAIPPAYKPIQANGCKTPGCLNFGIPPREGASKLGRSGSPDGCDRQHRLVHLGLPSLPQIIDAQEQ